MKKLFFVAVSYLPLFGFSQTGEIIPKVDTIPKTEIPKLKLPQEVTSLDYKKYIVKISPAPWNMPIAEVANPYLYKILVAKPAKNLEKMLIAKPKMSK